MATILYKGLSGVRGSLTVNTTDTLTAITNAIITAEGLSASYYADFVLERSSTVKLSANGSSTYTALGLTATDVLIAILDDDPTTFTKEQRQIQKLDIAAVKRAADGNTRATYDITQLPNPYNDNDVDPDENANTGGLVVGRPWI